MNYLPRELQKFNVFLDNLLSRDKIVFLYCVCLLMCEAGKMRLRNTVPGEDWSMVFFETIAGKRFHMIKLPLDSAIEAKLIEELRPIIEEYIALDA